METGCELEAGEAIEDGGPGAMAAGCDLPDGEAFEAVEVKDCEDAWRLGRGMGIQPGKEVGNGE